jgi:hypothetical protein
VNNTSKLSWRITMNNMSKFIAALKRLCHLVNVVFFWLDQRGHAGRFAKEMFCLSEEILGNIPAVVKDYEQLMEERVELVGKDAEIGRLKRLVASLKEEREVPAVVVPVVPVVPVESVNAVRARNLQRAAECEQWMLEHVFDGEFTTIRAAEEKFGYGPGGAKSIKDRIIASLPCVKHHGITSIRGIQWYLKHEKKLFESGYMNISLISYEKESIARKGMADGCYRAPKRPSLDELDRRR